MNSKAPIQATLTKVFFYLFTKYLVYFYSLGIINGSFKRLVVEDSMNTKGLIINSITYPINFIAFTLFLIFVFIFSTFFLLKVKNAIAFVFFLTILAVAEYGTYTYLASQINLMNGLGLEIISLIFFFVFFSKEIKSLLLGK